MLKTIHRHVGSEEAQPTRRPRDQAIRYYCVAHRTRSADRSPLTIYLNCWAYCPQGYCTGHDWVPIEPISYADLLRSRPAFLTALRVSEPTPA